MHDFRKLEVWKSSMRLAVEIYNLTREFPKEEQYGIISQIRRAAISIPSNIAEGAGRNQIGEFVHFIGIATGSSYELETQLMISYKVGFLDSINFKTLIEQLHFIQKQLYSLKKSLKIVKSKRKNI